MYWRIYMMVKPFTNTCTVKCKIIALPYFRPLVNNFCFNRFWIGQLQYRLYIIWACLFALLLNSPTVDWAKLKQGQIKPFLQYLKNTVNLNLDISKYLSPPPLWNNKFLLYIQLFQPSDVQPLADQQKSASFVSNHTNMTDSDGHGLMQSSVSIGGHTIEEQTEADDDEKPTGKAIYCKTQNIRPNLFSPTREELLFRSVLNSPSYKIVYTFYMRMFIRPCFEFAHCQLDEIKTRENKTCLTVTVC